MSVHPPIAPMLAKTAEDVPEGEGWRYEPKWDGIRALGFRDGPGVVLRSRDDRPLERYFPEVVALLEEPSTDGWAIDGEILVVRPSGVAFDELLQRIHPAESRVRKLAAEWPATLIVFDVLARDGRDLRGASTDARPAELETLAVELGIAPAPIDWRICRRARRGSSRPAPPTPTSPAAGVVAGYRVAKSGDGVGSLLLGLFDGGELQYVGHTSSFRAAERRKVLQDLQPYAGDGGFGEGRTPGGPSRWTGARDTAWVPLRPELVCEVSFDRMQGERFRHAATFVRWRPERDPSSCTFDQVSSRR